MLGSASKNIYFLTKKIYTRIYQNASRADPSYSKYLRVRFSQCIYAFFGFLCIRKFHLNLVRRPALHLEINCTNFSICAILHRYFQESSEGAKSQHAPSCEGRFDILKNRTLNVWLDYIVYNLPFKISVLEMNHSWFLNVYSLLSTIENPTFRLLVVSTHPCQTKIMSHQQIDLISILCLSYERTFILDNAGSWVRANRNFARNDFDFVRASPDQQILFHICWLNSRYYRDTFVLTL